MKVQVHYGWLTVIAIIGVLITVLLVQSMVGTGTSAVFEQQYITAVRTDHAPGYQFGVPFGSAKTDEQLLTYGYFLCKHSEFGQNGNTDQELIWAAAQTYLCP